MSKIDLGNDTGLDVVVKMSDGNPGAVMVLCDLIKSESEIDPQAVLSPLATIMQLDDLGIYGSSIYVLWRDLCKQSTRSLIMLIRARQLGFIKAEVVQRVVADQSGSETIDIDSLDKLVCAHLDRFARLESV